jgi:hypothetical protein
MKDGHSNESANGQGDLIHSPHIYDLMTTVMTLGRIGAGNLESGTFPLRFAAWVRGRAPHDHIGTEEAHHV